MLNGSALGVHGKCLPNEGLLCWSVADVRLYHAHVGDHFHSFGNSSENSMLAIEPLGRAQGDKELAAVGVLARVRHGDNSGACVFQFIADLIVKSVAING